MQRTAHFMLIWLALVFLLATTIGASFVLHGAVGLVVSFGIAGIKAGLVYWFFMHLNTTTGLNRLAALGAVVWLLILLAFVSIDYLTR